MPKSQLRGHPLEQTFSAGQPTHFDVEKSGAKLAQM
jgi:hypothetical protein